MLLLIKLKKAGNDELRGKKDRRRNSLNRTFYGDYINYKENFALKAVVGKDVKSHFADVVNLIDRRGKKSRICMVVSDFELCLVKLDKNKDKATRKQNPYAYMIFRRIQYKNLVSLTFSTLADGFFLLKASEEPNGDVVLECRKKTEFIAGIKKCSPSTQIHFSDIFNLELKKRKKATLNFQQFPEAPEGGQVKGKSCKVPAGIGKDAYPDIKEPQKVAHTRSTYQNKLVDNSNSIDMNQPPRNSNPPPSGRNPPPSRVPPGRFPPRNEDGDEGNDDSPPPFRVPPTRAPGGNTGRNPTRLPPRPLPTSESNDTEVDNSSPPPTRTNPGRLPPGRSGRMPLPGFGMIARGPPQ